MRLTSTIDAPETADKRDLGVRFHIDEIKTDSQFATHLNFASFHERSPWEHMRRSPELFYKFVSKASMLYYPEIFDEGPPSLPLQITIGKAHFRESRRHYLMYVGIGLIFPIGRHSTGTDWSVHVQVSPEAGVETTRIAGESLNYTRKDTMHFSAFSPFGLLPISGESKRPKVSGLADFEHPFGRFNKPRFEYDLECLLTAIVCALAKYDLEHIRSIYAMRQDQSRRDQLPSAQTPTGERLLRLQDMLDRGVITETEFERERSRIIDEL